MHYFQKSNHLNSLSGMPIIWLGNFFPPTTGILVWPYDDFECPKSSHFSKISLLHSLCVCVCCVSLYVVGAHG